MTKHWQKMIDTRDYPITRGTLEHAALQASWRTAQRSEAHRQQRRQRAIEAARVSIVAALLCVPVAIVVWLAQLPWWAFGVVALAIWIGAFAEWSK